MKDFDEDLFKPLSAKVGRKQYASGGREITGGYARGGDHNKIVKAVARRKADAQRARKAGRQ